MTAPGMISALIIRNARRPLRFLRRKEPGSRRICGLWASDWRNASSSGVAPEHGTMPHCCRLAQPLPPQGIGQTAAMVAWLPKQVVQRPRALRVQGQAIFTDDAHAGMHLMPTVTHLQVGFAGHGFGEVHTGCRWSTSIQLP